MMFTPMLFIKDFFSWSLFFTSLIVLIHWEYIYAKHPERFWVGSNQILRCKNCKDKTCQAKKKIAQKVGTTFESEERFFRFWTAAESYGKLYGNGVWWALKQDFLNDEACRFEQVSCPDGYVATVCIKR